MKIVVHVSAYRDPDRPTLFVVGQWWFLRGKALFNGRGGSVVVPEYLRRTLRIERVEPPTFDHAVNRAQYFAAYDALPIAQREVLALASPFMHEPRQSHLWSVADIPQLTFRAHGLTEWIDFRQPGPWSKQP